MGAAERPRVEVGTDVEALVGVLRRRSALRRLGRRARSRRCGRTRAARARRCRRRCGRASTRPTARSTSAPRPIGVRAARLPRLGARPRRDRVRARRRHDEPRRHLAVHRARPLARTGRHDRAAAVDAARRRVGQRGLGRDAALLRRVRVVPAHVPPRASTVRRRSSSCCSTGCSRVRCSTRSARRRPCCSISIPRRIGTAPAASPAASSAARAPISSSSGSPSSSVRCPSTSPGSNARARTRTTSIAKRFFHAALAIRWSA